MNNSKKLQVLVTDDDNMCLKSMTNFSSKPPISDEVISAQFQDENSNK